MLDLKERRINSIIIGLIVAPYFLIKIAYGDQNEYIQLDLAWIQIFSGFVALLHILYIQGRSVFIALHTAIWLAVGLHAFFAYLYLPQELANFTILFNFSVVWLYLYIILFSSGVIDLDRSICITLLWFERFSKLSVMVCIFSTLLKYSVGISLFMNNYGGGGWYRAHALMSEPSALAAPLAFLLLRGLFSNCRRCLTLAILGIVLVQSALVIVICLISIVAYSYIFRLGAIGRCILLGGTLIILSYVLFIVDCESRDVEWLSNEVIAKAMCGSKSLLDFSQNLFYNERLETFLYVMDALERYDRRLVGFGFNSSQYLMPLMYNNVENSLFASFVFYFGWLGAILFAFLSFAGLLFTKDLHEKRWAYLYTSLFVSVMLNSAGGFYSYGIFFFILYLSYRAYLNTSHRRGILLLRVPI
jgi:hypothetical protein